MATITVNITNETAEIFRKTVKKEFGEGKGKLGSALDEAMKKWSEEREQKEIKEKFIATLKRGFNMGKLKKIQRGDLYDRRIFFD